jgi:hypothetical protein
MGSLKISPSTDNWFNTNERPVVRVNVSGENDNWIESPTLGFGTRYNDWESQWFGFENNNLIQSTGPDDLPWILQMKANIAQSFSILD